MGPAGTYTTGLYAGSRPSYSNTFAAMAGILKEEGFRGWLRGVGPSMARASLVTAGQVASYDHSKYLLKDKCVCMCARWCACASGTTPLICFVVIVQMICICKMVRVFAPC